MNSTQTPSLALTTVTLPTYNLTMTPPGPHVPPICTKELNITLDKGVEDTESGAVMYIIAVLTFYSLGIVVMIVKYLKTERKEMEEEMQLENFFKGIPHKRIEHERDAVNRIAIQAFHTLTAARERHDIESDLNSARSSYTECPSARGSIDEAGVSGHHEIHHSRRHSQHNLHPLDYLPDETFQYRHSSYDDLGRYQDYEEGLQTSRLSLQEGSPKRQRGRISLQLSQHRPVDERSFGGEGHYLSSPFRDRNENITGLCSVSDQQTFDHISESGDDILVGQKSKETGDGNYQSSDRPSFSHNSDSPNGSSLYHKEDSGDGPTPSKVHRVSFDVDNIVIDSDQMFHLVSETPSPYCPHRSDRKRQLQRPNEKSLLLQSKHHSTDGGAAGGIPGIAGTVSGLPRSRTEEHVGAVTKKTPIVLCSCALCQESVKRHDFKDKKKEKKSQKSKIKIPQISITRSSTSGEIAVPSIDYRMGKSHHTGGENQPPTKHSKKSAKLHLFGRSGTAHSDKKSCNKSASGIKQNYLKSSSPKDDGKETPASSTQRLAGRGVTKAEQIKLLGDSQSYDSSSSLIPRGKGSSLECSPQQSPAKFARASNARMISHGPVQINEMATRSESLPNDSTTARMNLPKRQKPVESLSEDENASLMSTSAPSRMSTAFTQDPSAVTYTSSSITSFAAPPEAANGSLKASSNPWKRDRSLEAIHSHFDEPAPLGDSSSTADDKKHMLVTEL